MRRLLLVVILLYPLKLFCLDNKINYFGIGIFLDYPFNKPLSDNFLSKNKCYKSRISNKFICKDIVRTDYNFYQKNIAYYDKEQNKITGVQHSGTYNIDCEKYYLIWDKKILQNENFYKTEFYLPYNSNNSNSKELVRIEYKNKKTEDSIIVMCLYSDYINASYVGILLLSLNFFEEK